MKIMLLKIIAEFGVWILAFLHVHTGDGQNNENRCERYTFLY